MDKYIFWYKKEIVGKNLSDAMKLEKKSIHVLSSIERIEEEKSESTPALGFTINSESDYED